MASTRLELAEHEARIVGGCARLGSGALLGRVPRVAPATLGAGAGGGAPPSSPPSHSTEDDTYDQELGRPMRVKG